MIMALFIFGNAKYTELGLDWTFLGNDFWGCSLFWLHFALQHYNNMVLLRDDIILPGPMELKLYSI